MLVRKKTLWPKSQYICSVTLTNENHQLWLSFIRHPYVSSSKLAKKENWRSLRRIFLNSFFRFLFVLLIASIILRTKVLNIIYVLLIEHKPVTDLIEELLLVPKLDESELELLQIKSGVPIIRTAVLNANTVKYVFGWYFASGFAGSNIMRNRIISKIEKLLHYVEEVLFSRGTEPYGDNSANQKTYRKKGWGLTGINLSRTVNSCNVTISHKYLPYKDMKTSRLNVWKY